MTDMGFECETDVIMWSESNVFKDVIIDARVEGRPGTSLLTTPRHEDTRTGTGSKTLLRVESLALLVSIPRWPQQSTLPPRHGPSGLPALAMIPRSTRQNPCTRPTALCSPRLAATTTMSHFPRRTRVIVRRDLPL
jgi:hypothetical protein